jgi:YD repeat-containing protein
LSYLRTLLDIASASKVISFSYDEDGNLTSQSIDSHTVTSVPDHAGRPAEILVGSTPVAQNIKYLAYGTAYEMTRGAVTETFGFDKSYRMTSQQVLNGTNPLIDRGYSYDKAGNLVKINDNLSPERGKTFGYDDLGRLRSQTMQQLLSTLSYSYDSIGNRQTLSSFDFDSATSTSTWLRDEYTFDNGGVSPILEKVRRIVPGQPDEIRTFSYDAIGNVTNDGLSRYTYDLRNNLVEQADTAGQPQISFRYDSTGLRVLSSAEAGQRIGWSVNTYLQPDGKPFLDVTLDETLNMVEEKLYVHQGNKLFSMVIGTSAVNVFTDHIGYPIATLSGIVGVEVRPLSGTTRATSSMRWSAES